MSRFVIDASIVLTWCFPDEESQKAEAIAERIAGGDRVMVPAFWRHEMLNALLVGEKRKRLTPELTQAFIERSGSPACGYRFARLCDRVHSNTSSLPQARAHGL